MTKPFTSSQDQRPAEIACRQPRKKDNRDSRQIYNGLPILTAQPSDDKQQCPHYLYGTMPK